ncbi:MAG: hypothetical protein JF570_10375, partial [Caulobacter sp.]|nr:hypothetical protein [Caulobacter sp.]
FEGESYFGTTENSMAGSFPVTIIHGFGDASPSAQAQMSELGGAQPETVPVGGACMVSTSYANMIPAGCEFGDTATKAETISVYNTLMGTIVSGVTGTASTRHHDVGILFASRKQGGHYMSVQSAISVAPSRSEDGGAAARAFEISAYMLPGLETAAMYVFGGSSWTRGGPVLSPQLIDVTPGQMASVIAAMPAVSTLSTNLRSFENRRRVLLQAAADAGYSTLMTPELQLWSGELFYKAGERGYTFWQSLKGGGASDPGKDVQKTTQIQDTAAIRKRYMSVSAADGNLSFDVPPDIVTGDGAFPRSLPFVRTYSAGAIERLGTYKLAFMSGQSQTVKTSWSWQYSGPDSDQAARLGGGWGHNYDLSVTQSSDGLRGLGISTAVEASQAVANVVALNEIGTPSSLADRVRILMISNMASSGAWVVKKGASSEAFVSLPDGRLSPPAMSTA